MSDQLAAGVKATEQVLEHFGVKGMKWGVRKANISSAYSQPKGLEHFSRSQAASMTTVAEKMHAAYGFQIDEYKPFGRDETIEGFEGQTLLAVVLPKAKGDRRNAIGVINDLNFYKETLRKGHDAGWFAPTIPGRQVDANLTHEAAHAYLHANDAKGRGAKRDSDTLVASIRDVAWRKATDQAIRDGDASPSNAGHVFNQMGGKISKYALESRLIQEYEAEAFAAYHWSPNPPKFVDVYMNEIHKNLGKSVEPFSGRTPYVS